MPNHVINTIQVVSGNGDDLEKFLRKEKNGEDEFEVFDFNLIIPMSPELGIEKSSIGSNGEIIFDPRNTDYLKSKIITIESFKKQIEEYIKITPNDEDVIQRNAAEDLDKILELDTRIIRKAYRGSAEEKLYLQMKSNREKYGYPTWYEWSIANWETKWNAYSCHVDEFKGAISISFDTAWSPPRPIFEKMAELLPNHEMVIDYFDEGDSFAGIFHIHDGGLDDYPVEDPCGEVGEKLRHALYDGSEDDEIDLSKILELI